MALVMVVLVRVPQAAPLQPVPDTLHVTPWLFTSLVTVELRFVVCPWSIPMVVLGVSATEMLPAALTVRESCAVTESGWGAESVAFTVKVVAPEAVGVPEIVPAALNDSPAGSAADPEARLQVRDPVPPVPSSVVL